MKKVLIIAQADNPKLVLEHSNQYIDDHTYSLYPELNDLALHEYAISASVDDDIIGGIVASKQFDTIHINSLGVASEYRHAKIGTHLLEAMEQLAMTLECHTISLSTLSYQAFDFYKKFGYELYGQLDDYPRRGVTKYLLYKRLSSY